MRRGRSSGSLSHVADAAGVSIATASRVLNGSSHPVSEGTRARVVAAAAKLGYSPSALARALVTQRSRIIGVMVGDIVDAYFAEIARGVEDVAARAGYMTIVCNADRRTELEIEQLAVLSDYLAEGVVFAGSGFVDDPRGPELASAVERARERGVRVVALATRDFDAPCIGGRQPRRGLRHHRLRALARTSAGGLHRRSGRALRQPRAGGRLPSPRSRLRAPRPGSSTRGISPTNRATRPPSR